MTSTNLSNGLPVSHIEEKIWQFLRGNLPTAEFEQWFYDTPELKKLCGSDLFLEFLSVDYQDRRAVSHIKDLLRDWAGCKCVTWSDNQTIPAGYETANLLEKDFNILKKRTPWLKLIQCVHCNTHWYYMEDEIYYMHRLTKGEVEAILSSDEWPDCFDRIIPSPPSCSPFLQTPLKEDSIPSRLFGYFSPNTCLSHKAYI